MVPPAGSWGGRCDPNWAMDRAPEQLVLWVQGCREKCGELEEIHLIGAEVLGRQQLREPWWDKEGFPSSVYSSASVGMCAQAQCSLYQS